MRKISVIGTGYVGLVTGICLADLGNSVTCIDIDAAKIASLQQGKVPIYEMGLEELLRRNANAGRLSFTTSYESVRDAEFLFIAVGTPPGMVGEADLQYVETAAASAAPYLNSYTVIINKSTVPVGTGERVAQIIRRENPDAQFSVVSNPEFLREGRAVEDFMHPDRIVLGSTDPKAAQEVGSLYNALTCPVLIVDLRTAEMIKYASNAFLATRISFINEIAAICDELGADVKMVARGMGLDKRIGPAYLDAGLGYGGSCFPKDVEALEHMAASHGCHPELLRAVQEINRSQRRLMVQRLREIFGHLDGLTVAVFGLSFKPDTDDLRGAASIEVVHMLQTEGAAVRAYDPAAGHVAQNVMRDVVLCEDAYQAATGSDAVLVVTEWNEFKQLDMERVRDVLNHPVLLDGRNLYDPEEMERIGFIYAGIGRGKWKETLRSLRRTGAPRRGDTVPAR